MSPSIGAWSSSERSPSRAGRRHRTGQTKHETGRAALAPWCWRRFPDELRSSPSRLAVSRSRPAAAAGPPPPAALTVTPYPSPIGVINPSLREPALAQETVEHRS